MPLENLNKLSSFKKMSEIEELVSKNKGALFDEKHVQRTNYLQMCFLFFL